VSIKAKARKREALYEAQSGICIHCGRQMPPPGAGVHHAEQVTFEHLKPRADGGTNALKNLALAHGRCNTRRDRNPLWRKARRRVKALREAVTSQNVAVQT
jgi:5-methylcytosine-specific restriction endonuclease McrA